MRVPSPWSLVMLTACSLLLGSCHARKSPLVWDLATGWDIKRVGWPASNTSDTYVEDDPRDLTILYTYGRRLHETTVFIVFVERQGTDIRKVLVHFSNGDTVAQAYPHARRIMEEWALGVSKQRCLRALDKWYAEMKAGKPSEPLAVNGVDACSLGISIRGPDRDRDLRKTSMTLQFYPYADHHPSPDLVKAATMKGE